MDIITQYYCLAVVSVVICILLMLTLHDNPVGANGIRPVWAEDNLPSVTVVAPRISLRGRAIPPPELFKEELINANKI